ncbi:hypothetical protein FUA23_21965 [Neolewinella aurantiaca]|uniref:Uncharacterized protein n=1 Tax=Neolewinella aurantiaca TaxID=2602767 RepID=A0A5C7EZC0_9BACT|nr:hypothetical protein [Neolewinella aurantiaca]TXF81558.1 hypothetical protein FUA23_21965 [Neolewinella aurantiaca]
MKDSVIETLLENHDESYLRVNIAVVEEQYRKGKIKNVAGYLLKAFADDYSEQIERGQVQSKQQVAPDLFDQESQLKKDFEEQRRAAVQDYLKKLSEEERSAIQNKFLAENEDNIRYKSVSKSKDFEHPMIQNIYVRFVASRRLPKKYHSFEDFKATASSEEQQAVNVH